MTYDEINEALYYRICSWIKRKRFEKALNGIEVLEVRGREADDLRNDLDLALSVHDRKLSFRKKEGRAERMIDMARNGELVASVSPLP